MFWNLLGMVTCLAKFPVKITWRLAKVALIVLLIVTVLKALTGSMHKEE
jgi:hypothetical protein